MSVTQSLISPYSIAREAAITMLKEWLEPIFIDSFSISTRDIRIPGRVSDLASPILLRHGNATTANKIYATYLKEIDVLSRKNMPKYVGINSIKKDPAPMDARDIAVFGMTGSSGIDIFSGVEFRNGYINFSVNDEFLLHFATIISKNLPAGELSEKILLPVSMEYVHARLLNYASIGGAFIPSKKKRRALWLAFALTEKLSTVEHERCLKAVVRTVYEALPIDSSGGAFGGICAHAIAALIGNSQETLNLYFA